MTIQTLQDYVDGVISGTVDDTSHIGSPGGLGFGVGVAPSVPSGFTLLSDDPSNADYGNYEYSDGSIMCWIPAFYYRIADTRNQTSAAMTPNDIDIKPSSAFTNEAEANTAGYALHRAFKDGGSNKVGFMVDKYLCSKAAHGTGYIASSIKNGLPISTASSHNPIADLTACSTNNYYQAVTAAHARDGIDGAVNASSIFFCSSRFITSALAMLALAHGQASSATDNCAWYDATNNFPKGCNNNALADVNDTAVKWESDGYSNCGKTGSAGYGGGAGNEFAKSTHNGQDCGVADLNGLMWEVNIGLTCVAAATAIQGMTRANPCVVTWAGHGRATGDYMQIAGITQTDWIGLKDKIFTITVIDADTFSLDGVDSSAFTAVYDDVTDPGTITRAAFYAAAEATAMANFTSGNSTATDHWGATGIAAMMEPISLAFETGYPGNGFLQKFGDGAGQVLSAATSGNDYKLTGLGCPSSASGMSPSGSNLFGLDYNYQYLRNELCLRSGGNWSNFSAAGVWAANWLSSRAYSLSDVGFRLACYPV